VAYGVKLWLASEAVRARDSALEFWRSPKAWFRRRALWLSTALFLTMLLVITGAALIHHYILLSERSKEVRRELFQRDLRDLVGRFDADERFVLDRNLEHLLQERRALHPLLLPRQYYQGLPSGAARVLPRQPPRNCFVQLEPQEGASLTDDRVCAYFAENRAFGRYLFIAATLTEQELVPLKLGDIQLAADAIKLVVSANGQFRTWWLTYQVPPGYTRSDRYELTAFRDVGGGQRDRDRRFEGWAYIQRQAQGNRVYVVSRLDFREFLDSAEGEVWPPPNWRSTRLAVERQDASSTAQIRTTKYKPDGLAELSLAGLGSQIFNAYGNIQVDRRGNEKGTWLIAPPARLREKFAPSFFGFKIAAGDLLLPAEPTSHSESLPDTELSVTVSHPWILIEKGVWQIALYLVVLLGGGFWATLFFNKRLLRPIADWSRYSERLTSLHNDKPVALPYAERHDEVGVLATAINTLIQRVREQTARERRRLQEELANRQQNQKMIGHEIRSPLMSLMARHRDPGDRSRRYIDRMLAALPHLLGGDATTDAIGSRALKMEEFDLAAFLVEVAENAGDAEIPDVSYDGPQEGVGVVADVGAVEDAITHILNNANRHRNQGSMIRMVMRQADDLAMVEVWNDGDTIPEAKLEEIFELWFSTAEKIEGQGQGAGLFVARSYLTRMGGSVKAANHPAGVVFTMSLPVIPTA
jgi:signal transduction histidine kinase